MKNSFALIIVLFFSISIGAQTLVSPNGKIKTNVFIEDQLSYEVFYENKLLLAKSKIGIETEEIFFGKLPKLLSENTYSVSESVKPLYGQETEIENNYNELKLTFEGSYNVFFRAYNNGVAYRFELLGNKKITVIAETAEFNFTENHKIFNPEKKNLQQAFEPVFYQTDFGKLNTNMFTLTPVLIVPQQLPKVIITEADLFDYPGLNLKSKGNGFTGVFAPYVSKEKYEPAYRFRVTDFAPFSGRMPAKTANYMAKISAPRLLPWRLLIIENSELNLLSNRLVYLLGRKSDANTDFSWVKPGLVAWDWYNHLELTGVDFKPGKNTQTYKYFIDFAARNNIPYINIDEGWNHNKHVFRLNKEIDVKELLRYAASKQVGVFLWFMWDGLEEQLEAKLDSFANWGAAGLKVDFFDRDDQKVVAFSEKLAIETAKRKLLLNLHGIWKPTGLERLYPNIINREGVVGLENNKFGSDATAMHNVTLPYTRFVMGSADYTPGSLRHVTPEAYKKNWMQPKSKTTRCHQLAMYVCYYGALQMMPEAPTTYEAEPEMLKLIASFPTIWHKTVPLAGEIAKYAVLVRNFEDIWYVGGMTDEARIINLEFNFLDKNKKYKAKLYTDGANTNSNPAEYKISEFEIDLLNTKEIRMNRTGGFVIIISELK